MSIRALFSVATVLIMIATTSDTVAQAPKAISFQGFVTDSLGSPIDTTVDIAIRFFLVSSGGAEEWSRTYSDVTVDSGVFNLILEDGPPSLEFVDFDDSLWLQVEVGAEVINPRTILTASPSTLGLSLPIDASVLASGGTALSILNTATSPTVSVGVSGQSTSGNGRGVWGLATHTTGENTGVYGLSTSTGGRGVVGEASKTTGDTHGGWERARGLPG